MITKLEGREKVQIHLVANKLNEVIEYLNEKKMEKLKAEEKLKEEQK